MDRPVTSLQVYRQPIDPRLARFVAPDVRRLSCGILRSPSHYLFLGEAHPIDEPEAWPNDLKTVLWSPAHYGLQMYRKFLDEAWDLDQANAGPWFSRQGLTIDLAQHPGLDTSSEPGLGEIARTFAPISKLTIEREHLAEYRRRLRQTLIEPNVDRVLPEGHLLWRPAFRNRHPSINWGGTHDLLVVRLIWAITGGYGEGSPILPPNRNPRKISRICPDNADLRRCVEPTHYYVALTRAERQADQRRVEWLANQNFMRGQARMRKHNPTDWEIQEQLNRALLEKGYSNEPPPEPESEPRVDLIDWSKYPDI